MTHERVKMFPLPSTQGSNSESSTGAVVRLCEFDTVHGFAPHMRDEDRSRHPSVVQDIASSCTPPLAARLEFLRKEKTRDPYACFRNPTNVRWVTIIRPVFGLRRVSEYTVPGWSCVTHIPWYRPVHRLRTQAARRVSRAMVLCGDFARRVAQAAACWHTLPS